MEEPGGAEGLERAEISGVETGSSGPEEEVERSSIFLELLCLVE